MWLQRLWRANSLSRPEPAQAPWIWWLREHIGVGRKARAFELLRANFSPAQREQYEQDRPFEVTGSDTGRRYRIYYGNLGNVVELGVGGEEVHSWCFHPTGNLPVGDVMLAQKLALELFEREALGVANRIPHLWWLRR